MYLWYFQSALNTVRTNRTCSQLPWLHCHWGLASVMLCKWLFARPLYFGHGSTPLCLIPSSGCTCYPLSTTFRFYKWTFNGVHPQCSTLAVYSSVTTGSGHTLNCLSMRLSFHEVVQKPLCMSCWLSNGNSQFLSMTYGGCPITTYITTNSQHSSPAFHTILWIGELQPNLLMLIVHNINILELTELWPT